MAGGKLLMGNGISSSLLSRCGFAEESIAASMAEQSFFNDEKKGKATQ